MSNNTKKIAIVTGGGSGLGYAIAEKFTQSGIETIIAGRDKEKLNSAKEKLGSLCHAMSCDLSDLSSIPAFINTIIKQFVKFSLIPFVCPL